MVKVFSFRMAIKRIMWIILARMTILPMIYTYIYIHMIYAADLIHTYIIIHKDICTDLRTYMLRGKQKPNPHNRCPSWPNFRTAGGRQLLLHLYDQAPCKPWKPMG